MSKESIIKTMNKIGSAQDLVMVRINKSITNNDPKHIEDMANPYTEFLKFLQDPKNKLADLLGGTLYSQVRSSVEDCQIQLDRILSLFKTESKGFFGTKTAYKKLNPQESDRVKINFNDLKDASKSFNASVEICNQRLNAIPKDKF